MVMANPTATAEIQKKTGKEVFINIQEILKPELDAQLVSESVALQLGIKPLILHLAPDALLMRAEALLEKHGFWAVVRSRFLPP